MLRGNDVSAESPAIRRPRLDVELALARRLLALVWVSALLVCGAGCTTQTIVCSATDLSGCVIDEIEVSGNRNLDADDIRSKIASGETGGLFEGVPLLGAFDALTVEYERFDRFVLERDLARVQRFYRARGHYQAVVRAGRVRRLDPEPRSQEDEPLDANAAVKNARLAIEIVVEEGPAVLVYGVHLAFEDWDGERAADVGAALTRAKARLRPFSVFTEERYEQTRADLQRALVDLGYAYARVEPSAKVDLERNAADITYKIRIGPRCTFGPIRIEGLGELPEWQVRPALGVEPGEPFSASALEAAEVALSNLGVFGSITFEPQLSKQEPFDTAVPILITVQQAALRTARVGGGLELGDQVALRGLSGWQNRNFFGALDRLNIEGRPRLVLYPLKLATLFDRPPHSVIPEVSLRMQYGLPVPLDPRTTVFVEAEGSIARPRNADTPDDFAPVDPFTSFGRVDNVVGYRSIAGRLGLDRRFFLSRLHGVVSHNLQLFDPFSYNLSSIPDDALSTLLVSYLELFVELDLRKGRGGKYDAINPRSGFYASTSVEIAGRAFGGDADDVKIRPEMRFYAPIGRRFVLAGKLATSLLFATSYGEVLDAPIPVGAIAADGGDPELLRRYNKQVQLMEIRGLFSGGPGSNRGYGFNQIAPHRVLDESGLLLSDADAIGGRTLWEASLELRANISGELGGALFVDASDVTPGVAQYRLSHPHVSSGIGLRYGTPVGPLRVDLGFRIPGLQVLGEEDEVSCIRRAEPCTSYVIEEGDPTEVLGLPLAVAIAIGNAF